MFKGQNCLLFCFDEQKDFEKQARINISISEKIHEKMKKVTKKYNKVTFSDSTESLSKFRNNEKEGEGGRDFYGHYLSILKIHIFVNMQLHNYFLRKCQPLRIENINLRFFLLNIFETSNDFYKESFKTANINKSLEIQCEIKGDYVDLIPNDYQTLEHIFLIFFFSLISKNLLDNVEVLCELENNEHGKIAKFSLNFFKEKSLITSKKNKPNEVALYLTDKVFESTNLSENALFQKISENLKKYKIYEIALNMILFNLKKLNCMDFQIQDSSSENQIITLVSFVLPIANTTQNNEHNKALSEYEANFFKFNSLKFVQKHSKTSKISFVLEKISNSRNLSETHLELNMKMIKSSEISLRQENSEIKEKLNIFSPNEIDKKRFSEEFLKINKIRVSEEAIPSDKDSNSNFKINRSGFVETKHIKKLKFCSQVMMFSLKLTKDKIIKKYYEENKLQDNNMSYMSNMFNIANVTNMVNLANTANLDNEIQILKDKVFVYFFKGFLRIFLKKLKLKDLIAKILEKNIILFEDEYANTLKNVFSEVLKSDDKVFTSEKIDEELGKINKETNRKSSKLKFNYSFE